MKLKHAPWDNAAGGSDIDVEPSTQYAIDAEVIRGREKFPGGRYLLAALVEEVGELAEAVVARDPEAVLKEAIQVAAVAVRIAEEGDATEYRAGGLAALTAGIGRVARNFLQKRRSAALEAAYRVYVTASCVMVRGDATFDDVTEEASKS